MSEPNRVAIVTSAAKGPGREYAQALASAGALVVLADSDVETGTRVAEHLRLEGLRVHFRACDSLAAEGLAILIKWAVERFGRLDILVNNPTDIRASGPVSEQLRRTFEAQVYPAHAAMQAALPAMRSRGFGRIVNCAASSSAFGVGADGPSRAATAALFALTRSIALDNLDMDVRINAVAPIIASSERGGEGGKQRRLDPEVFSAGEVAPLVTYLARPDCRITGETLSAGGGRHASLWTATSLGFFMPGASEADIAAHLDDVLKRETILTPVTTLDEIALISV